MERRLATILVADVVGYSRLMEGDEEATVAALTACRDLIGERVAWHRGRVFGSAGDSVVAEFASPVEAVRCAVDIQRDQEARNAGLPESRRMRLRIGINLGDVVVEDGDLLGDGVNVAARLEALSDAGGVFISGTVFDQVWKQPDLGYEYLGAHAVKNIAAPVPVYRVLTAPAAAGKVIGDVKRARSFRRGPAAAALVVVLAGLAAAAIWWRPWAPTVEPAVVERMALPLPDKPSIVVLPFANPSGDAGQDHVADGITEDIITALSQISRLFVIARNSSFVFKGKVASVKQVAEDLGVRYVLAGSVRTSGERIRITAQLIDAVDGNHLWTERYDRDIAELFAMQDEITDRIVVALRIKLTTGEETRVHRKHTRSLKAWHLVGRGAEHFYRVNKADNVAARDLFEQAIAVDKDYALAHVLLAWTHWQDGYQGWSDDRVRSFARAASLAENARALDDALPDVHALLGMIHLSRRNYDAAVAAAERAVADNPNHATNVALLALILRNAGRPQDAIRRYKTAMRLSPYYPSWFLEDLGFAYLDAAQPEEALITFEKFLERKPDPVHVAHAHMGRALAFHRLGQHDMARAEVVKAVETDPGVSSSHLGEHALSRDGAGLARGLSILRALGLPE